VKLIPKHSPMNLVTACFKILFSVLLVNRILFAFDMHKKFTKDRENDITFYRKVCNKIDYKELGRHSVVCVDIEHRLSTTVVFQTARYVIDDTLYRELNFRLLMQLTSIVASIFIVGAAYNKYQKLEVSIVMSISSLERGWWWWWLLLLLLLLLL